MALPIGLCGTTLTDRKTWVVNWFKQNELATYLYIASQVSPAGVSASQTTNAPMYGSTANNMEQYFNLIKSNYGQSFYDQLFNYFAANSMLYVDSIKVNEWHIYGSNRIGIYEANMLLAYRNARDADNNGSISPSEYTEGSPTNENMLFGNFSAYRGNKHYELTNHLGNVLAVITDKKLPVCSTTTFVSYQADVISASDYSPFGAPLPSRTFTAANANYRFGFNGKENDNEVKGDGNEYDYGERMHDPRLGRWLSIDPKVKKYPQITPYSFCLNNPLYFIDKIGEDIYVYFAEDKLKKFPVIVIKTDQFNQNYTLPAGMRETIMSKASPSQLFPEKPLVNIELPKIDLSTPKSLDATVVSVGGEGTAIGGLYASVDFVTINKGTDKGGTFAYFTFGAGFGAEAGAAITFGNTDFIESSEKNFNRSTFEGASKIIDGGGGGVSGSLTTRLCRT